MSKIFRKATLPITEDLINRKFLKYGLSENPFPITPYVNQDSPERKYNGSIYDDSIRQDEFEKIKANFLSVSQNEPDHLRLGFIVDKSFIGRGNGKSSFLLHLNKAINSDYCLDISNGINKCFSIYFSPDGSGTIKTFDKFVDNFFQAILKQRIINEALAILRYEAIHELNEWKDIDLSTLDENEIVDSLNDKDWITKHTKSFRVVITKHILKNPLLASLPGDSPLYNDAKGYKFANQEAFVEYYATLKKDKAKLEFVFDHLISIFIAAGFNGSYVLVDDFEKIPDFQSSNQKKDFATQLRTVLFDGGYLNSKIGFFNFVLALHAGVPRLMAEPWSLAGMEQRVPMSANVDQKHIIDFGKLENTHAITLIKKYLNEFRSNDFKGKDLSPFDEDSIILLANNSEMNISKILKNSNQILEIADAEGAEKIDSHFVKSFFSKKTESSQQEVEDKIINKSEKVDLLKKIDPSQK